MHQVHLNERTFATDKKKRCYQKVSRPLILPSHGTQGLCLGAPVAGQPWYLSLRMLLVVQTYRAGETKAASRALDKRGCIQNEQFEQAMAAITRHRDPTGQRGHCRSPTLPWMSRAHESDIMKVCGYSTHSFGNGGRKLPSVELEKTLLFLLLTQLLGFPAHDGQVPCARLVLSIFGLAVLLSPVTALEQCTTGRILGLLCLVLGGLLVQTALLPRGECLRVDRCEGTGQLVTL